MDKPRVVLGVDPGVTGGISLHGVDDGNYSVMAMPEGNEEIAATFRRLAQRWDIVMVCCEKSQSMPGNAAATMFTYGEHNGFLKCACFMLDIPMHLVTPQKWQKTVSGLIPSEPRPKKPDTKGMTKQEKKNVESNHKKALAARRRKIKSNSLKTAKQRYPKCVDRLKHKNKDGLADALHIGRYGVTIFKEG